jgi:plasmid stabilization system protein ParE
VRWYEEQRPGLGAEFFDAVVETTALIRERPESGPLSPDGRTRRLMVHRFPYQVVYSVATDKIVIVAVAHLKRRPGYWERRV